MDCCNSHIFPLLWIMWCFLGNLHTGKIRILYLAFLEHQLKTIYRINLTILIVSWRDLHFQFFTILRSSKLYQVFIVVWKFCCKGLWPKESELQLGRPFCLILIDHQLFEWMIWILPKTPTSNLLLI